MTPKPFMYALEAVFEPIYQQQEEDISHQEQDKLPEKLDKKTGIIDKIA